MAGEDVERWFSHECSPSRLAELGRSYTCKICGRNWRRDGHAWMHQGSSPVIVGAVMRWTDGSLHTFGDVSGGSQS